jgi:N-acetyl-anhydromuramyl-L-alanine amidase AmpD
MLALVLIASASLARPPRIIDRPLPFDAHRAQLTLDYIRAHYDSSARSIAIDPVMIVIHATETPSVDSTLRLFDPDELPPSRTDIQRGGILNVSSHYLVDRDGTIYRLLADTIMARHVIGLNRAAIGIENVGGDADLTPEQVRSDVSLVRMLLRKHPRIRYLIGHLEYTRFRGTPLWEERDPGYLTPKTDPAPAFMTRVRAALRSSHLASVYSR